MAIAARRYDAAVFDYHLPDGRGIDLIDRARERSAHIQVLVLTGSADHAVISSVHAKKASYLLKPVDLKHLEMLAHEAKDRRDASDRRLGVVLASWTADCDLSDVEAELLELGARGVPREMFARRRRVRPDTIRRQIQSLLRKTGHSTFEAAVTGLLREAIEEP
jgi:DNA-binding NarL/FixJ family response regulator